MSSGRLEIQSCMGNSKRILLTMSKSIGRDPDILQEISQAETPAIYFPPTEIPAFYNIEIWIRIFKEHGRLVKVARSWSGEITLNPDTQNNWQYLLISFLTRPNIREKTWGIQCFRFGHLLFQEIWTQDPILRQLSRSRTVRMGIWDKLANGVSVVHSRDSS